MIELYWLLVTSSLVLFTVSAIFDGRGCGENATP